jgi:hypothetical protein
MGPMECPGAAILVPALALGVPAVWMPARMGARDPAAGLLAVATGGAPVGEPVVRRLVPRRGRGARIRARQGGARRLPAPRAGRMGRA